MASARHAALGVLASLSVGCAGVEGPTPEAAAVREGCEVVESGIGFCAAEGGWTRVPARVAGVDARYRRGPGEVLAIAVLEGGSADGVTARGIILGTVEALRAGGDRIVAQEAGMLAGRPIATQASLATSEARGTYLTVGTAIVLADRSVRVIEFIPADSYGEAERRLHRQTLALLSLP